MEPQGGGSKGVGNEAGKQVDSKEQVTRSQITLECIVQIGKRNKLCRKHILH